MMDSTHILLRSRAFSSPKKGTYKADEVDALLQEIGAELDKNIAERQELIEKITMLADRVQKYKSTQSQDVTVSQKVKLIEEKAIERAKDIISAAGDKKNEILTCAQAEYDKTVNSAVSDAKLKVDEIEKELADKKNELEATKKSISALKSEALKLYQSHIDGLNGLSGCENKPEIKTENSSFKVNMDSFNKDNDFSDFFGDGKNNK